MAYADNWSDRACWNELAGQSWFTRADGSCGWPEREDGISFAPAGPHVRG